MPDEENFVVRVFFCACAYGGNGCVASRVTSGPRARHRPSRAARPTQSCWPRSPRARTALPSGTSRPPAWAPRWGCRQGAQRRLAPRRRRQARPKRRQARAKRSRPTATLASATRFVHTPRTQREGLHANLPQRRQPGPWACDLLLNPHEVNASRACVSTRVAKCLIAFLFRCCTV